MKYASIRGAACAFALFVAAFIAVGAARADEIQTAIKGYNYTASIRGGAYFQLHSDLQNTFTNPIPFGGMTVTLEQEALVSRSSLAIDYEGKSQNGNKEQIIPVTFEHQWYQGAEGIVNPYFVLAIGGAWVTLNDVNTGVNQQRLAFDSSFGLGIDTPWQVFGEVRYNWIAPTLGEDFSGPSVLVGVRF